MPLNALSLSNYKTVHLYPFLQKQMLGSFLLTPTKLYFITVYRRFVFFYRGSAAPPLRTVGRWRRAFPLVTLMFLCRRLLPLLSFLDILHRLILLILRLLLLRFILRFDVAPAGLATIGISFLNIQHEK